MTARRCSAASPANGSGAWTYTTAALTNGAHSLTATATDVAGNTGVASTALSVTVDTVAPTGGTPDLVAGSDSGSSTSDNLTNMTSPTFTVALNPTVAVGDTVQLLLGGSALAHNVTHTITAADITAGSVSLAVTAGDLGADGCKSISAKFADTAGNTSTTTALAVTLDTTAPVVTESLASDTGSSASDKITANDTLTGSGDANAVVTLKEGSTTLGTTTANASGVWSFTPTGLANGAHTIVASETDTAGNTGTSSLTFTLDTTAPTVASVVASGTGITSGSGKLAAGSVVTLTMNLSEAVTVAGGTPTLTLNDGGTASYTGGSGSNALTFSYTVAAGQNTSDLTVTALNLNAATVKDVAGNTANLTGAVTNPAGILQIDTTGPAVTESLASDTGFSASDKITANDTLTGSGDANAVVTLKEGSTTLGTTTANASGVWSFTPTGLANGVHTIVASETDTAGNTGTSSLTFTLDTTAPTVASVVASGTGITSGSGKLAAGSVVTLTMNLSEAVTVAGGTPTLTLNDGGTASYTGGSGSNALTFSYTVAAGQNTSDLTVTALNLNAATVKDVAGNTANLTGAVTNPAGILQIDTTGPVERCHVDARIDTTAPVTSLASDTGFSASDKIPRTTRSPGRVMRTRW